MSYLTVSSGLSFIDQDASPTPWRFPIPFQIILLVILFVTVWWFPESPRWLVKIGRGDQARFIMERLRGNEGENILAEAEFQDIRSVSKL
jgi:hypothetical protein